MTSVWVTTAPMRAGTRMFRLVLTLVRGGMIIAGQGRLHDNPDRGIVCELGCSPRVSDPPNSALIGAGLQLLAQGSS